MQSEKEIKDMLKKALDSNGLVSPTTIDTLEWVLDMDNDVFEDLEKK